ncbi:MAG: hypothetical protein WC942_11960 [Clostridia bacterium]|jgi:hypothetical protein
MEIIKIVEDLLSINFKTYFILFFKIKMALLLSSLPVLVLLSIVERGLEKNKKREKN